MNSCLPCKRLLKASLKFLIFIKSDDDVIMGDTNNILNGGIWNYFLFIKI